MTTIVVTVKQVGLPGDDADFASDLCHLDRGSLEQSLNKWDACAIEEALLLRERLGDVEVVAVTAGPPDADAVLRRCLAMGADRAVRVAEEPLDPISTARAIAVAVAPESPALMLSGAYSADSVQGSTGAALAQFLGLAHATLVRRIEWKGEAALHVERELEGGIVEVAAVDLPALLTIQTGINQPRHPTLRAIKQSEQRDILVVEANLGEPAFRVRKMFAPVPGEHAELLHGAPIELAEQILALVRERVP